MKPVRESVEQLKEIKENKYQKEIIKVIPEHPKPAPLPPMNGPSPEFLARLEKSKKGYGDRDFMITDWDIYRKKHNLKKNDKIFICK